MTRKTIVITGGATGIGFGIANRLTADGHHVVLVSRSAEKLQDAAAKLAGRPGAVSVFALDVRDHDGAVTLMNELPRVDGLVNNAAGNFTCPAVDISFGGFRAVVEISLYGTFNFSQAFARRAIDQGIGGAILNIVATYAWTGAPMVAHSAAAKSAMIAYTKSVAREWGPHGIRVNALAPGFVPTDNAIAGILADPAAQQRMRDLIPLGDFGTADDIAEVAAFLLSEQSRYVTGAVVTADGGRSLGIGMHDGGGSGKATTKTSAARS